MEEVLVLVYGRGVKLKARQPDTACGVLRSGPWGHPGNSRLAHSASASENGAHEGHTQPPRAPFSLVDSCRRPSQLKTQLVRAVCSTPQAPFSLVRGLQEAIPAENRACEGRV
uniref:Uncharacterized protein n=1 Tax=Micrurus spixii TaxID=129469 RepID=A0A2D4LM35_9SAUR